MKLVIVIVSLLWAVPVWADTCVSHNTVPTFPANQPAPKVCDLHGAQKVILYDENGQVAVLQHTNSFMVAKNVQALRERVKRLQVELASLQREEQDLMVQFAEAEQHLTMMKRAQWRPQ